MSKTRIEAFTDAVIAIIMTILVLELHQPEDDSWKALFENGHKLIIYVISFISLAIYWNNHHHLFQLVRKIDGWVLWANNFFIFTLSLFPFATGWIGDYVNSWAPQAIYGLVVLAANVAYYLILLALIRVNGEESAIAQIYKKHSKMYVSIGGILLGLFLGYFIAPVLVLIANVFVLLIWIVPEKRIEKKVEEQN